MANKIFKIGTLLYDDEEGCSLVVSIHKQGNCFYYSIFDQAEQSYYTITNSGLNRMVQKGYWKIEYEPQEKV
jgi:hypothetical protein